MVTYRFTAADTPALRRLPFERMRAEGMERTILWNRADPALPDWLECVDPARALCWLAYAPTRSAGSGSQGRSNNPGSPDGSGEANGGVEGTDGFPVGAVWLNPLMGLCGCVHFCVFRAARPEWEPLGRQAIVHLFATLPLASLLAVWPACYQPVTRAARAWGFGAPVRLPRACHMPTSRDPARCRDGLLAVLRREDVATFLQ